MLMLFAMPLFAADISSHVSFCSPLFAIVAILPADAITPRVMLYAITRVMPYATPPMRHCHLFRCCCRCRATLMLSAACFAVFSASRRYDVCCHMLALLIAADMPPCYAALLLHVAIVAALISISFILPRRCLLAFAYILSTVFILLFANI